MHARADGIVHRLQVDHLARCGGLHLVLSEPLSVVDGPVALRLQLVYIAVLPRQYLHREGYVVYQVGQVQELLLRAREAHRDVVLRGRDHVPSRASALLAQLRGPRLVSVVAIPLVAGFIHEALARVGVLELLEEGMEGRRQVQLAASLDALEHVGQGRVPEVHAGAPHGLRIGNEADAEGLHHAALLVVEAHAVHLVAAHPVEVVRAIPEHQAAQVFGHRPPLRVHEHVLDGE